MPSRSRPNPRSQRLRFRSDGGRPPLPREQSRTRRHNLNLTPFEEELLEARALAAGVPSYHLVRCLALYGALPVYQVPAVNYGCVAQLSRIGTLLNQAVRRLNSGEMPEDLREILAALSAQLTLTRTALVTPAEPAAALEADSL